MLIYKIPNFALRPWGLDLAIPVSNLYLSSSSDHLLKALLKFHGAHQLTQVNPDLVRQTLKNKLPLLQNQTRENKLLLLEHAMSDDAFQHLQGIQLLPLGNGTFQMFTSTAQQHPVFLDSVEHSRLLLPGLTDWFVDKTIPGHLWTQFTKAAQLKCKLLTPLNGTKRFLKNSKFVSWQVSVLSFTLSVARYLDRRIYK